MRSFYQDCELLRRDESYVTRAFAADDDGFLIFYHLIENTGQILTKVGVGGFAGHE